MSNVIWILGSIASGKTSLNKSLLNSLGDEKPKLIERDNCVFTHYGLISSLGIINESQCCGLDRVSSRLKNQGIENSLVEALKVSEWVIVESIMSASTWVDFLRNHADKLVMVHLYASFEATVNRLKLRKFEKLKHSDRPDWVRDIDLSDANYEFIRKTRMQYKSIYDKYNSKADSCIEIDTTSVSTKEISRNVIKLIEGYY